MSLSSLVSDLAARVAREIKLRGVPAGGVAGDVLRKVDGTDFKAAWSAAGGDSSRFLVQESGVKPLRNFGTDWIFNVPTAFSTENDAASGGTKISPLTGNATCIMQPAIAGALRRYPVKQGDRLSFSITVRSTAPVDLGVRITAVSQRQNANGTYSSVTGTEVSAPAILIPAGQTVTLTGSGVQTKDSTHAYFNFIVAGPANFGFSNPNTAYEPKPGDTFIVSDASLYVNGGYPARPDTKPVVWVGPTNPATLGVSLDGDCWLNTDPSNAPAPTYVATVNGQAGDVAIPIAVDGTAAAWVADTNSATRKALDAVLAPQIGALAYDPNYRAAASPLTLSKVGSRVVVYGAWTNAVAISAASADTAYTLGTAPVGFRPKSGYVKVPLMLFQGYGTSHIGELRFYATGLVSWLVYGYSQTTSTAVGTYEGHANGTYEV